MPIYIPKYFIPRAQSLRSEEMPGQLEYLAALFLEEGYQRCSIYFYHNLFTAPPCENIARGLLDAERNLYTRSREMAAACGLCEVKRNVPDKKADDKIPENAEKHGFSL